MVLQNGSDFALSMEQGAKRVRIFYSMPHAANKVSLILDVQAFFEYSASAMVAKYNCRFHPDREGVLYCEKCEHGYCEKCLAKGVICSDPELYCKHRTHCVIWENCRELLKKSRAGDG